MMRPLYIETDEDANWLRSFQKASFGGDRSAAGRYAANIRWQGHQRQKDAIPQPAQVLSLRGGPDGFGTAEAKNAAAVLGVGYNARLADDIQMRRERMAAKIVERLDPATIRLGRAMLSAKGQERGAEMAAALRFITANGYIKDSDAETCEAVTNLVVDDESPLWKALAPVVGETGRRTVQDLLELAFWPNETPKGIAELSISNLVGSWTTNTEQHASRLMLKAAEAEFPAARGKEERQIFGEKDDEFFDEKGPAFRLVRAALRVMYEDTQETAARLTRETGYTHVELFRGTSMPNDTPVGVMNVKLRSLTSWDPRRTTSSGFAVERWQPSKGGEPATRLRAVVMQGFVPFNQILALPIHGFGTGSETEFLVLGPSVRVSIGPESVDLDTALAGEVTKGVEITELDEEVLLADLIKVSFGGDRSAAGRYAAEQRWKNHRKKGDDKGDERGIGFVAQAVRVRAEEVAARIPRQKDSTSLSKNLFVRGAFGDDVRQLTYDGLQVADDIIKLGASVMAEAEALAEQEVGAEAMAAYRARQARVEKALDAKQELWQQLQNGKPSPELEAAIASATRQKQEVLTEYMRMGAEVQELTARANAFRLREEEYLAAVKRARAAWVAAQVFLENIETTDPEKRAKAEAKVKAAEKKTAKAEKELESAKKAAAQARNAAARLEQMESVVAATFAELPIVRRLDSTLQGTVPKRVGAPRFDQIQEKIGRIALRLVKEAADGTAEGKRLDSTYDNIQTASGAGISIGFRTTRGEGIASTGALRLVEDVGRLLPRRVNMTLGTLKVGVAEQSEDSAFYYGDQHLVVLSADYGFGATALYDDLKFTQKAAEAPKHRYGYETRESAPWVAAHEVMHAVAAKSEVVSLVERAVLQRRATGTRSGVGDTQGVPTPMLGVYARDKWLDGYSGRVYDQDSARETLTTGMEYLLGSGRTRDTGAIDRELTHAVLGALLMAGTG